FNLITIGMIDDLIVVVQPDGEFIIDYIKGHKFQDKLEYDFDKLVGYSLLNIIYPDDRNHIRKILTNRTDESLHIRIQSSTEKILWVVTTPIKFKTKSNKERILLNIKDITKEKELEEKLKESQQKIREIKEQELKYSEEKFENLAELLPDTIFEADLNLDLTYVNSVAFKKFGYTPEDLEHGLNITQLLDPEYLEKATSKIQEIFKGVETEPEEYRLIKKDGTKFYVLIHSRPIMKNGEIVGLRGIIHDINKMYNAEQKLIKSEEKYRLITENANDLIAVLDMDFHYLFINKNYESLGYSKEDLLYQNSLEKVHPDDIKRAIKAFRKGVKRGGGMEELRIKHKDGSYSWFEVKGKTFTDEHGSLKALLISRDITERKMFDEQLKESEEKYRSLFENMNAGFAYHEVIVNDNNQPIDYKYHEVNPTFEALTGLKKEDLIGKTVTEAIPGTENDPADWIGKFGKVGLTGIPLTVEDYSEAIDRWFKVSGYSPKKGFFAVTFTDITDRKKTEEYLKESEEQFRTIAEQSLMGICIIQDFEIKYINKQMADIYGYSIEEIMGWKPKEFVKVVHPDYKEVVINQITEKLEGSTNSVSHYIAKIIKKDGNFGWVENYSKRIPYQGRQADLLTQIDVTDKIEAEEKLKASEQRYRELFENSPIALMEQDFSELKLYVDRLRESGIDDFEQYFSDDNEEVLKCISMVKVIDVNRKTLEIYKANSKDDFLDYMNSPVSLDQMTEDIFLDNKKEIISLILNNTSYESEVKSKTLNGDPLYLYAKTQIIPGYENSWSKVILSIMDVTERKRIEEKLKNSELKYHELFEMSPDGVILADTKGNIIECNSGLENIIGTNANKFIGKNFLQLEVYDEGVLEKLNDGYNDLLGENLFGALEIPITSNDKQTKWVQIRSTLITMNEQTFILAVIHDITTLKQTEEALKSSEKKYRDLLESSSIGVMELDVNSKDLIYINPKLLNIIGYTKNEFNEDLIRHEIMNRDDLTKLLKSYDENELEFRITDKFGKLKWLSGKRVPNFDENGELASMRIWLDDITENKMYEELIYELNINFLNFTTNNQNNIELLLNTALKLLNGELVIYAHKIKSGDKESYQIITSDNELIFYDSQFVFENLIIQELFKEQHDFPQSILGIDRGKYAKTDSFVQKSQAKVCFGKIIRSQDGLENVVCVFFKNNPLLTGQDKLVLFLISDAIEIEQRRWQVQQDLEKQNITLDKINQLKTELFSRTSHELKTPLISIKGFTELLLTIHRQKLDSEIVSILEEIKTGSKRLETIVNSLLESTKLEAGQLELKKTKENLSFLINFCVNELKGLAKLRNQSLLLNIHHNLQAEFDKERIYEVISNLLLNAIKYTPPGGKITIQSKTVDDSHIISISDTGIGFTEDEKKMIFKQFGKIERYGQGWDVAIEGTGLGLYITKKLVELHNGKIWLESEGRNKGSSFYFSIPMVK
ncbi:MAG: PAS domain S-box protein, partial [Candidatus Thorarchaeota archaeon]